MVHLARKDLRSLLALSLTLVFTLSSCGRSDPAPTGLTPSQNSEKPEPGDANQTPPERLRIVDGFGVPVADATILIGTKVDAPFVNNLLITNTEGEVEVPDGWTDPQPVTIEAKGFVRATYLARAPTTQEFRIRPTPSKGRHEISGLTKDFGNLSRDGFVDVGLVLPVISRGEMLNFQIASLVSPVTDTLSLPLGQSVEIPSNLAIPSQRENYIVPITLDKPRYRTFVPTLGAHTLVAVHGRFPVKTVIDEFRADKPLFDVLNHFEFKGSGLRNINAQARPVGGQDISINQIAFSKSVPVRAPAYDSNLVLLALTLTRASGGYYPSDVKKIEPNQMRNLKVPTTVTAPGLVLSVLRSRDTSAGTTGPQVEEFTAVLQPDNISMVPEFIPLTRPPELRGGTLVLDAPKAPASVAPAHTYTVFSRVETQTSGKISLERKVPEWEIFADDWIGAVDLPELPSTSIANVKYRWEVFFLGDEIKGRRNLRSAPLGPAVLETVTHVSKNAADYP